MPFRITVLKRAAFDDLIQEYVPDERRVTCGPCERFEDGQVFEVRGETPPAGFCARAWASLFGDLAVVGSHFGLPGIGRLAKITEDRYQWSPVTD